MSDGEAPHAIPFRPKRRINRKTKKHIVFDPEARKEFLTGFHKRKLERKKKAITELEEQLKEERKRLKQEARDNFKKLLKTHQAVSPVVFPTENYDLENHSVSIVELSAEDLAEKNNWIGPNRVQYEEEIEDEEASHKKEEEIVPGMELNTIRDVKVALKKKATEEVKKSKAFQLKNKMEQRKSKKKSIQQKRRNLKIREKKNKRKGKLK